MEPSTVNSAASTLPDGVILNKKYPDCCELDALQHIRESLGNPLPLPSCLQERLDSDWAADCEDDLLILFRLMTGVDYSMKHRDNTYNSESDLSTFMVFSIFAPRSCGDWVWTRDVFVVIEEGSGGDPRYCNYGPAKIYRLEDVTIGDSGFLDWKLSWYAQPISDRYEQESLDSYNDRICIGYGSSPYSELTDLLYAPPVWCERRESYVGRFKGSRFPATMMPHAPFYGG